MSKRRAVSVTLGAVLVTALLSGCAVAGQGGDDQGAGQGTPSAMTTTPSGGTVSSSPGGPPRGLPPTSPSKLSGQVTLTGDVVFVEIEGGCLTLRVNDKGYELMGGDRGKLQHGAHVTVVGRIRDDIATICQVGPVIEVLEVRPA